MMHNPERTEPCVLVLGMFDGVHRGHQALFLRARELAARAEGGAPSGRKEG